MRLVSEQIEAEGSLMCICTMLVLIAVSDISD